jgi:hypothetical protein
MDDKDKQSKAADIREKFRHRNTLSPDKQIAEDSKVGILLEKAKEHEKIYSEVGQERAIQNKKERDKHNQAKTQYRQTTLRILLRDLARLKNLESRFLSENGLLTYEKVFVAGLETIEKMNDQELHEYIENSK